jgi:hypothetical protein
MDFAQRIHNTIVGVVDLLVEAFVSDPAANKLRAKYGLAGTHKEVRGLVLVQGVALEDAFEQGFGVGAMVRLFSTRGLHSRMRLAPTPTVFKSAFVEHNGQTMECLLGGHLLTVATIIDVTTLKAMADTGMLITQNTWVTEFPRAIAPAVKLVGPILASDAKPINNAEIVRCS